MGKKRTMKCINQHLSSTRKTVMRCLIIANCELIALEDNIYFQKHYKNFRLKKTIQIWGYTDTVEHG